MSFTYVLRSFGSSLGFAITLMKALIRFRSEEAYAAMSETNFIEIGCSCFCHFLLNVLF